MNLVNIIDHMLLKAEATTDDKLKLREEASRYKRGDKKNPCLVLCSICAIRFDSHC